MPCPRASSSRRWASTCPSSTAIRSYPLCDVAQYLYGFANPGQPGTTYLYGHARAGMFLPLLDESERNDGAGMIGAIVKLYTADSKLHLYQINIVKRHATDLSLAFDLGPGQHRLIIADQRRPARDGAQAAGRRPADRRLPRHRRRGAADASPAGLRRLDPADAAEVEQGHPAQRDGDGGQSARTRSARRLIALAASLMPKMPATAPMPASTTVTAVSFFMISDRLLLICDR